MKLASFNDGSADGELHIVSKDLSQSVSVKHIASSMQEAMDSWSELGPVFSAVYCALNEGRVNNAIVFDARDYLPPLARPYYCAKADYSNHLANLTHSDIKFEACFSHAFSGSHFFLDAPKQAFVISLQSQFSLLSSGFQKPNTFELDCESSVNLTVPTPTSNLFTFGCELELRLKEGGSLLAKRRLFSPLAISYDEMPSKLKLDSKPLFSLTDVHCDIDYIISDTSLLKQQLTLLNKGEIDLLIEAAAKMNGLPSGSLIHMPSMSRLSLEFTKHAHLVHASESKEGGLLGSDVTWDNSLTVKLLGEQGQLIFSCLNITLA